MPDAHGGARFQGSNPKLLEWVKGFQFTGETLRDAPAFLECHGFSHVAVHVKAVALEARNLAERFGLDANAAELAGILHDIAVIVPNTERVALSRALELPVFPEEEQVPMILHQQHGKVFARELFGIRDGHVLDAIECHTTLKANSSPLDRLVFLADKISWDQPGIPPYLNDLLAALENGLDAGTRFFLEYLISSPNLLVVHPWLREAHAEFHA
jgi:predicted HD superfamily hydrolase involved in NAD metabolism